MASEEMDVDDEMQPDPEPSAAIRIKLKINGSPRNDGSSGSGSKRPARAATKKAAKKVKRAAMEQDMGMSSTVSPLFSSTIHVTPHLCGLSKRLPLFWIAS